MPHCCFESLTPTSKASPLTFASLFRFRIHIIDLDPSPVTSGGWLEDTSLVEKYSISEDEYNKRSGTFRKFKEQMANPSAFRNKINVRLLHGRPLHKYQGRR
ncbi:tubulin-folding cofactor B isoform X2 [Gossypium hirsutum]|uniref:Tubulin-folding cofactor B isoform X2 n=1 Tax=Gossypium hirsutum TaxID=3635 RepID=A0ABM3BJW8_GOSHI|nr:tubulin-folding cofactor B-like isoform X2 [Gossypium hirsutum]